MCSALATTCKRKKKKKKNILLPAFRPGQTFLPNVRELWTNSIMRRDAVVYAIILHLICFFFLLPVVVAAVEQHFVFWASANKVHRVRRGAVRLNLYTRASIVGKRVIDRLSEPTRLLQINWQTIFWWKIIFFCLKKWINPGHETKNIFVWRLV